MCGIVGSNFLPNIPYDKIVSTLLDRGPNNQCFKTYENIFLAHTRLSIIDLDNEANQPMEFGNIVIVFNGEIYNYQELKIKHNLKTTTKSDTEVIIRLYQKYKENCLKYLNGAFAFCIYDKLKKSFFCARDRFGKKPFYYYFKNNKFIFSSKIKPILDILQTNLSLNKDALNEYLSFFAPISNITFYKDILKLPKSSYLIYNKDNFKIKKYYKINTKKYIFDEKEAILNIEQTLIDAIKYRIKADVEIGVLLSGGVDSSLIASIYSTLTNFKIKTFSVGYSEFKKYDELNFAKILSKHISSEHFEVILEKNDFLDTFEQIDDILEEPLSDTSAIALYKLTKHINKTGIKSVLSGEGSDELFFGYEKYFKMAEFYKFANSLSNEQKRFFKKNFTSFNTNSKESTYFKRIIFGESIYQSFAETFTYEQKKSLFNKHVKGIKFTQDKDIFDYMSKIDLDIWIGEVLLQKLDKISMSNSVENRNPFLDVNLVNLIFKIDNNLRAKKQKYLLKEIATKYIPKEIIDRKKKGFNSPYNEWLQDSYKDKLLYIVLKANKIHNLFNEKYLKNLYIASKQNKFRQHFYSILLFSKWFLKNYF